MGRGTPGKRLAWLVSALLLGAPAVAWAQSAYLDLGVGATYFDGLDRDHHGTTIRNFEKTGLRLEATAYRQVSPSWDLGAGVLFDWMGDGPQRGSYSRLGLRVVELKQHWTGWFASRYFVTVNRIYRELPAFGYGLGAGVEARLPGWKRYKLAADAEHTRTDAEREAPLETRNFTRLWIFSISLKRRF